ncbi:von Willebrand factor A domain-containing protein 5A-like [Chanos chanos]|uniref:von Willebrand factor A domain-containing protein 5A-like n=1 Tax=Chanos chanos TaxID=29144 RepID=A0A6J2UPQ3_CHACN|nr:von Willebrand factor A domain-containing protein 5A-like [Chanos chanos]
MVNCCGLVTVKKEPVPLKSIEVEVHIRGHVATVKSTLQYVNKEEQPLEALFVFPLPGEAAVCHFSAKIGDKEVVAEVQEKQKAREQYDDALSSGQQAFLLEESDESPDVFRLSVGSLPPGESAAITIIYVMELTVQADHALRFCLPAVLNPRYTPAGTQGWGSGIVSQVTSVPAGMIPYSLSLSAHMSSPNPISKVESNCPLEPLVYHDASQTKATVSLSPGHKFDRDVELLLYYQNAHQPTAIVEAGLASGKPGTLMGDPVIVLSLYPEFPAEVMSSLTSRGEFVFLVDQSGSMHSPMHNGKGSQMRIESARDTLLLLLKSLPLGCYFNIYGFGSRYTSFFPKSVQYSQETMDQSLKKVSEMRADLGGTEILEPLKHIYSQPCVPGHPRQLFIFTDGEVSNTKAVLDLVKSNVGSHRCFSFGIGQGASTALVNGMAKEGCGHAQFITGKDRLQPKVMQSLRFALQPAIVDIAVKWKLPDGVSVTTLSPPLNVVFQGQRALLYAQLTGLSSEHSEGSVTVDYSLANQPITNQLSFSLQSVEDSQLALHRLGARALIRSLEMEERAVGGEKEELKRRVVELSLQAGVSSAFTAFIATYKGSGQPVQGPLVKRNVPAPKAPEDVAWCSPFTLHEYPTSSRHHYSPDCSPHCQFVLPPVKRATGFLILAVPVDYSLHYVHVDDEERVHGIDFNLIYLTVLKRMACCAAPISSPPVSACGISRSIPLPQPTPLGSPALMMALDTLQPGPFLRTCSQIPRKVAPQPQRDPLLQLISLQKASGSWELESALAEVFGKTEGEVALQMPVQVDRALWATVLALIWLYGFRLDAQEEWQFLAMKAVSWIQAQKGASVSECVKAGNALLGCQVEVETLGL